MLQKAADKPSFADHVSEATGLAPMFAMGVLDRCCKRAGVTRDAMVPSDLEKLLPHLEPALLVYKTGREVMAALDRLKRLGAKASAIKNESLTQSTIRKRPGFVAQRKVALR